MIPRNTSERPPASADLPPEDLHTVHSLLPACTTQLLLRLLDALRSALPRFPDAPASTALLSQLTYCATLFARSRFDFQPLFDDDFSPDAYCYYY